MKISRFGVTMIELILSVFILAVALLPTFDLLTKGTRQVRISREETLAVAYNAELIDQIMCMPFNDIATMTSKSILSTDNGKCLTGDLLTGGHVTTLLYLSPLPDEFQRTISIEEVIPDYLKKITVSVKWGNDIKHEVKYSVFMEYSP
ncbi:MAG: hypothetical protein HQM09_03815 [Candidatus Riflebacteria bacterium]|nr:hypothetical protein [Candidatus Riflebacteria bacterium]